MATFGATGAAVAPFGGPNATHQLRPEARDDRQREGQALRPDRWRRPGAV